MNKQAILQKLRENKLFLAEQFGIETLGLFGSYAADTATAKSDIDLCYIPKEGITVGYEQKILLEEYLAKILQNPKIDLVNYRHMNPVVKKDMEKKGIILI